MEFKIKFASIDILSKSLSMPPDSGESVHEFGFNFSVGLSGASEMKVAFVPAEITIVLISTGKEYGKLQTLTTFEIENFDEVFILKGNQYEVPVDLEILLKSAALSTCRGIFFSELRGTYLQGLILPFIDIPGMVRRDRANLAKPEVDNNVKAAE